LEKVSCNLCGSEHSAFLFEKADRHSGQQFNIVRCESCRLVFVNPRITLEEAKDVYTKENYFANYFRDGRAYLEGKRGKLIDAKSVLSDIELWRRRLGLDSRTKGRLLEVGSAVGWLLQVANELGWESHGVEISTWAAQYGSDVLGQSIFCGVLEDSNFQNNFFQLAIINNVLQHNFEPHRTLSRIYDLLEDKGLIYISVPNWNYWRTWSSKVDGPTVMPREHLFYFTSSTLSKLVRKAGFHIHKLDANPRPFETFAFNVYRLRFRTASTQTTELEPGMPARFDPTGDSTQESLIKIWGRKGVRILDWPFNALAWGRMITVVAQKRRHPGQECR